MPRSKKDIDKELMYKKLLPTSAAAEQRHKLPPELFSPSAASPELERQPDPVAELPTDIQELPNLDSIPTIEDTVAPARQDFFPDESLPDPEPQQAAAPSPAPAGQPQDFEAPRQAPASPGSISVSFDSPIQVIVSGAPAQPAAVEAAPAVDDAAVPVTPPEAAPNLAAEEPPLQEPPPAYTPEPLAEPHNLMEDLVAARLDEAMQKFRCCMCEKCRKDVNAIALNHLKPFYVIEEDPCARIMNDRDRAAEVATALVKAILTVKSNPSH